MSIVSSWCVVGVCEMTVFVRDRVVRAVVCNPRSSQDEITTPFERSR